MPEIGADRLRALIAEAAVQQEQAMAAANACAGAIQAYEKLLAEIEKGGDE